MAETLSTQDLARIERDLDDLVMPSRETVRALVAENRRLDAQVARYANALARIDSIIHHAGNETT